MNLLKILKMAKADDGAGGGMPTPPNPPPSAAQQPPTPNTPPAAEGGDKFDELGYKIEATATPPEKAGETPPAGDPPPKAAPTKISEIENPSTGYNEKPPVVPDAPPAPPAAPADPPPAPDDIDKALVGLPADELVKTKEFIVKNAMTLEQAKAYTDLRKQEMVEVIAARTSMEKQAEQQKLQLRASWHKELKDDPNFGGDKLQTNIVKAERVLGDFGPELKKQLTEGKGMLPPNIMRMLARMADKFYATDALPQGDPPVVPAAKVEVDEALSYYT